MVSADCLPGSKEWLYWLAIGLAGLPAWQALILLIIGLRTVDQFIRGYALRLAPYALWVLVVSLPNPDCRPFVALWRQFESFPALTGAPFERLWWL